MSISGFRTGCKLVCLDRQGKLLHNDVIYPHTEGSAAAQSQKSASKEIDLCKKFNIEAMAFGNGTAEAARWTHSCGQSTMPEPVCPAFPLSWVNESGASIYSASEIARDEFPDYDITVRVQTRLAGD